MSLSWLPRLIMRLYEALCDVMCIGLVDGTFPFDRRWYCAACA